MQTKTKIFLIIIILLSLNLSFGENYNRTVNDISEAEELLNIAKNYLQTNFGMIISGKINLQVVSASKLDELYHGIYRGSEIGLYQQDFGGHHIYIMQGLSRDKCLSTIAHEYTHAWQHENCPLNQDIRLKEGFARWIEVKILRLDGAYQLALDIERSLDPVYGYGLKILIKIEESQGERAVINYVKTALAP